MYYRPMKWPYKAGYLVFVALVALVALVAMYTI
jgi:hypothetical protein